VLTTWNIIVVFCNFICPACRTVLAACSTSSICRWCVRGLSRQTTVTSSCCCCSFRPRTNWSCVLVHRLLTLPLLHIFQHLNDYGWLSFGLVRALYSSIEIELILSTKFRFKSTLSLKLSIKSLSLIPPYCSASYVICAALSWRQSQTSSHLSQGIQIKLTTPIQQLARPLAAPWT